MIRGTWSVDLPARSIGIVLGPANPPISGYATQIIALDQSGDKHWARSDRLSQTGVKCARVQIGDYICAIDGWDTTGATLEEVSDRMSISGKPIITVTVGWVAPVESGSTIQDFVIEDQHRALSLASARESSAGSAAPPRPLGRVTGLGAVPAVCKYRIQRTCGWMQYDFKEFIKYFKSGTDQEPTCDIVKDMPRAEYFLNGRKETSVPKWLETAKQSLARLERSGKMGADLYEPLVRLSSQGVMGNILQWMRLVLTRDPHMIVGERRGEDGESMFLYGKWGPHVDKVSLNVQKHLSLQCVGVDVREVLKLQVIVNIEFCPTSIAEFSWHVLR